MRNASTYQTALAEMANGAVYVMYATMYLNDAGETDTSRTQLCLTPTEFTVSSNNTYSSGLSNNGFPLGNVVSDAMTIELDNHTYIEGGVTVPRPFSTYGGLRDYFVTYQKASASDMVYFVPHINEEHDDSDLIDYYGAEFVIRLRLKRNGSTVVNSYSALSLGIFTVYKDANYGNVVVLNLTDEMVRADKEYTPSDTMNDGNPHSLTAWFADACRCATLSYDSETQPISDKVWTYDLEKPVSCREIMSYLAMIACGNVRYETTLNAMSGSVFHGMRFYPYSSMDLSTPNFTVNKWIKLDTSLIDVQITGIKTKIDKEEYHYPDEEGYDAYAITITNPLIKSVKSVSSEDESILENLEDIYNAIGGKTFRIFSGEMTSFPFAEFMDVIEFTDVDGSTYRSFVTNVDYTVNGTTKISNRAPAPSRIGLNFNSSAATITQLESSIVQERTERQELAETFNVALQNSSGMHFTDITDPETQESTWFFHDKDSLAESDVVIKVSIDGIGISNDGGQTYLYGFTSNGNLIMDIISSNYINADWIKAGKLSVVDPNDPSVVIFEVDTGKVVDGGVIVDSGTPASVYMNASSVRITTTNEATDLNSFAQNIEQNGVSQVKTGKGFTFDDSGLSITSTENNVKNVLDETGMKVLGMDDNGNYSINLLNVTYDGVVMDNLTVNNELTFGKWQFESMGGNKMGCFFRG